MIVLLTGFVWDQNSVDLELCMNFVNLLIYLVEHSVELAAFNLEILYFSLQSQNFLRIDSG